MPDDGRKSEHTRFRGRARAIAFYLPQYHPIPENDEWWGKGFTEWTNVGRAKPLFPAHYQPRIPADLGYYDLRVAEVREAQARLARRAGIEAFCYYHYWFAGRQLLERPVAEVLASSAPDFPYCLCWANQTWSGIWHGAPDRILIEQTYPGTEDDADHFEYLLPHFRDPRYLLVDGRPLFVIFRPTEIPHLADLLDHWQTSAAKSGLRGIHFVAHLLSHENEWDFRSRGFDSAVMVNVVSGHRLCRSDVLRRKWTRAGSGDISEVALERLRIVGHYAWSHVKSRLSHGHFRNVVDYRDAIEFVLDGVGERADIHPCVIPNWDNTPRSGSRGLVLADSSPAAFQESVNVAIELLANREPERRLLFVKSWNEWAEGNHLEPDLRFGTSYIDAMRAALGHGAYQSESAVP